MSDNGLRPMFRDVLIFLAIMVLIMVITPKQETAPAVDLNEKTVYRTEDGAGRITERVTELDPQSGVASKTYTYFDTYASSSGTVRWQATLTGRFQETESGYVCANGTFSLTSYHSTYYEKDSQVSDQGDTFTCDFTVGERYFLIPMNQKDFSMSLTCAPDGTVS